MDLTARFLPKPVANVDGSGCRMSISVARGGINTTPSNSSRRAPAPKPCFGLQVHEKYAQLNLVSAERCARALGTRVKRSAIQFHHEVTKQHLWSRFRVDVLISTGSEDGASSPERSACPPLRAETLPAAVLESVTAKIRAGLDRCVTSEITASRFAHPADPWPWVALPCEGLVYTARGCTNRPGKRKPSGG
jgi:hypothetical protein